MQTPSEVVDSLLRKKKAERVGLHDSPWGTTLKKWVTQGMPTNEKGEPVNTVDHFGFDLAGVGGWPEWQAKIKFEEILEETVEWKVVRDGNGAVFKRWKDKDGTPEHVAFGMSSREIWERDYRPHLLAIDPARVDIKGARESLERRRKQGLWTFYGCRFIWESMRGSLGDYNMYMALADDHGWVRDFNRVYTDFFIGHYRLLIEQAGKPDGAWVYEDLGYKGRVFCNPKTLAKLVFPYFAEIVAFFHSYDMPVVLHSCGFTEPLMDLIVEAGFDGLNPMEVKAGNRLFWMAEKYGDKLAFVGGLDARILESGDRAVIRRGVTDYVKGMKARGARLVYASDHSISTNVNYEDFKYAIEVYREHMMY